MQWGYNADAPEPRRSSSDPPRPRSGPLNLSTRTVSMTTEPAGDFVPGPRILMGPGPTMADPRVLRAMSAPLLGQFDPEFTRLMTEVMDLCRFVFETENAATFPVSGTGRAAMEAALVSLVEPGDRV